MKVATTTVGSQGPQHQSYNGERLRAASQALARAAEASADVLVLPGGFFFANTAAAREEMADTMLDLARQAGIAIVFGIDQAVKREWTEDERVGKGQLLPFYGIAWSPTEDIKHTWQQRSTTSANQWYVPDRVCEELRLLRIGGQTLAMLMCGEIFNERVRQAITNTRPRPSVVVDIAHYGSRFRVWQGMKRLAELGLPSVCSVHVQCEYGAKHCYIPDKGRMTSFGRDDYVVGPPRIELKLWEF